MSVTGTADSGPCRIGSPLLDHASGLFALSGILLIGTMTVGASAADFVDADEIVHDDAVNILVALNVINGKDDGSHFDPKG